MKLSIVIVSYNVKYFLEQTLQSVLTAAENISHEIIVVDNSSNDGSAEMVKHKFPSAKLIVNKENVGFSRANNQAIRIATGEFVLLLNPDTVVEEDTLTKIVGFMDSHPEAGALGVKMLDGKGNFLPESKRGFPTPGVSFYKAFGFAALFPKSKVFAKYYLGHLSPDEVHEVEVLSGAFMFIRRSVLNEVGLLDEQFFMYGEDIDLSYRIIKAGYKNYYFPDTRIIHYKGESTKKGSLNYVRLFYLAMILFAQKHFKTGKAGLFVFAIKTAIYFRAVITLLARVFRKGAVMALDIVFFFGGIYLIKNFWASNIKDAATYYPESFMLYIVPLYILIWVVALYFSGGYDKPFKISRLIRGVFVGTLLIGAVYGFLDDTLRFSRAIIILGAGWVFLSAVFIRQMIQLFTRGTIRLEGSQVRNYIIAGSLEEGKRTLSMLNQSGINSNFIGFVLPEDTGRKEPQYLGDLQELDDIAHLYRVEEIIFCSKDIRARDIIGWMARLGTAMDYKIVPENSLSIIGSNSKNSSGELYAFDVNLAISTPMQRRNKRVFDLLVCVGLLVLLPGLIFIMPHPIKFLGNYLLVLVGRKSWVGFAANSENKFEQVLPEIRPGVLSPVDESGMASLQDETIARLNMLYAKNYSPAMDWRIIRNSFNKMGR